MNAFITYVADVPKNQERELAMHDLMGRFGGRAGIHTPERYAQFTEARRRIEGKFPMPLATFDQFMAHVLHALQVVGPDHIGISGDSDGGGGVGGFMDITGAPRITQALVDAGYTREDCAKMWGGNVLRVLRASEAHAHSIAANVTGTQATE